MPKSLSVNQSAAYRELSQSCSARQSADIPEFCPLCGQTGANCWLRAPDRFHGRSELYELARCPSCSLVWLRNPPTPSEMGKHYGSDYDKTIARGGADPNHWRGRRDELLRHKPGGAVLDLGCGSGGFLAN